MSIFISVSEFILNHGYTGIFIATLLEYACFPVSSEILFPFIGCCAAKGGLNIAFSVGVSTLGAICGCSFCYCIGRFGEKFLRATLFKKMPKLKLAVDIASVWFRQKGIAAVFFGRVFPLVRTYISFPAGMAKMSYIRFIFYTAAGAAIWNTLLISAGYFLGEHWKDAALIIKSSPFVFFMICGLIIIFVYILCKKLAKRRV